MVTPSFLQITVGVGSPSGSQFKTTDMPCMAVIVDGSPLDIVGGAVKKRMHKCIFVFLVELKKECPSILFLLFFFLCWNLKKKNIPMYYFGGGG